MPGRGTGYARLALTLIVTGAAVGVFAPPAATAATTPAVTAEPATTGDARVAWSYDSSAKAKDRTVELQRRLGTDAFATLLTKAKAPERGSFVDKDIPTRLASYRVRVIEAGVAGAWSAPATVDTFGELPDGATECPPEWQARAYEALNAFRAANGVDASQRRPVVEDINLARLARHRAGHLAATGGFTHAGFSIGLLVRWGYTLARDGGAGENLAPSAVGPEGAVLGWANSPGHRANELRRTPHAGFACAKGEGWHGVWVLIVGAVVIISNPLPTLELPE